MTMPRASCMASCTRSVVSIMCWPWSRSAFLAALLGGRALYALPLSFLGMMAAGGALGMAGIELPLVELGIALSIIVLGAAAALNLSIPLYAAMVLTGFFAIFHGVAHGLEMPADSAGLGYAAGFLAATALMHARGCCSVLA